MSDALPFLSLEQVFEKWKQEQDDLLRQQHQKQVQTENRLKEKREKEKEQKKRDSSSSFAQWWEGLLGFILNNCNLSRGVTVQ